MKKIITNLGFCLLFILIGCQPSKYHEASPASLMDAQLQKNIAQNEKLSREPSKQLPTDISNALMPKLSVNTPQSSKSNEKHFDISVHNLPAKTFFMGLVKDTKYSMIMSPEITGSISLNLKNVTLEQTLTAVRDAYGYEFKRTSYGYMVFPLHLETRIFTINYLNINRSGQSNTTINAGQLSKSVGTQSSSGESSTAAPQEEPSSQVQTTTVADFWAELKATLSAIVGDKDGHSVVISPQANLVIVKAYPDELRKVGEFLDESQDSLNRQVILETKILEVTLDHNFRTGINWRILGLKQGFTTNGSSGDLFSQIFSLHISDDNPFKITIDLLREQGNVQVLSSPRISTLNNQKAVIKVGDDKFFVTNVANTTTTSSGASNDTQDIELTPFFSGIALDVTPQINSDGYITLHIHPSISTVTDDRKTFTVSDKTQNLPLAKSSIRESDSIVRAKSGQIIVIGGLMENRIDHKNNSTPLLSKLPGVGQLFQNHNDTNDKTELVILLRPIVIKQGAWTKNLKHLSKEFKTIHHVLAERKKYL